MKLFANGCSFTWGGGLYEPDIFDPLSNDAVNQERISVVWPSLLAKEMNFESSINLSFGGIANQRIVRTTLDFFIEKIQSGEDVTDYLAIIQWTNDDRIEFWDNIHKVRYHVMPRSVMPLRENLTDRLFVPSGLHDLLYQRQEIWYKEFHSDKTSLETMFGHICQLGDFFHKHNIPYTFITLSDHFAISISETKKIYLDTYYNWMADNLHGSSAQAFHENEYVSDTDLHPSRKGHLNMAVNFAKLLKKKGY